MFAVIMQMVSISMFQGIFYDLFAEFKNPKDPGIQPHTSINFEVVEKII